MTASTAIDLEKKLVFLFDGSWRALKWDTSAHFEKGLKNQTGTHAVDILATRLDSELWLFEGKDPRSHWTVYKKRLPELHVLIAEKVRDTLASATWAVGRTGGDVQKMLRAFFTGGNRCRVVLWLEGIDPAAAIALKELIKKNLTWLNPIVIVTDRKLVNGSILGLQVNSLSGAPAKP